MSVPAIVDHRHAYSGREILQILLETADTLEEEFTLDHLAHWWHSGIDPSIDRFLWSDYRDVLSARKVQEVDTYPGPWTATSHHHCDIPDDQLASILPLMTQIADIHEGRKTLCLFTLNYWTSQSHKLFYYPDFSEYADERWPILHALSPKITWEFVNRMYVANEYKKGNRLLEQTRQEIKAELGSPVAINTRTNRMSILKDIHTYGGRTFMVSDWDPELLLGAALYQTCPRAVAYTFFDDASALELLGVKPPLRRPKLQIVEK